MDPAALLGFVIVAALIMYVLFGGADYGAGVWDLVAHGPTAAAERAAIAHAIAPIWEANHVWLILVVTVLFNAFPAAFATLGTRLHIPLLIALFGIVLRGSAFVFRAYGPTSEGFQKRWGRVFAGASLATPIALGLVVGAITEGRLDPGAESFTDLYVGPWLTPFAWSVGVFALALFSYLAAVYLTVAATDPAVVEIYRSRSLTMGVVTAVAALTSLALAGRAPHVREALLSANSALPLQLGTGVAAVATLVMLWVRRYWWARITVALQVAGILSGWALSQYPFLIRPNIRLGDAAAPESVLVTLLWILAAGAAVLLPALIYLFKLFSPHRAGQS